MLILLSIFLIISLFFNYQQYTLIRNEKLSITLKEYLSIKQRVGISYLNKQIFCADTKDRLLAGVISTSIHEYAHANLGYDHNDTESEKQLLDYVDNKMQCVDVRCLTE